MKDAGRGHIAGRLLSAISRSGGTTTPTEFSVGVVVLTVTLRFKERR
jgi:hypothetical protein